MLKNKNQQEKPTYLLNRACEYCGEPIADLAHLSRTHCEYQNNDGIIKDCKTAKARQNDFDERQYFQNCISEIRGIDKRIALMIEKKGENVNLQDLEAYDIHLDKPSELSYKTNGIFRADTIITVSNVILIYRHLKF